MNTIVFQDKTGVWEWEDGRPISFHPGEATESNIDFGKADVYGRVWLMNMLDIVDAKQLYDTDNKIPVKTLLGKGLKSMADDLAEIDMKDSEVIGISSFSDCVELIIRCENPSSGIEDNAPCIADHYMRVYSTDQQVVCLDIQKFNCLSGHFFMGYEHDLGDNYLSRIYPDCLILRSMTSTNGHINRTIFQVDNVTHKSKEGAAVDIHTVAIIWKPELRGSRYFYQIHGHYPITGKSVEFGFEYWINKIANFGQPIHELEKHNNLYDPVLIQAAPQSELAVPNIEAILNLIDMTKPKSVPPIPVQDPESHIRSETAQVVSKEPVSMPVRAVTQVPAISSYSYSHPKDPSLRTAIGNNSVLTTSVRTVPIHAPVSKAPRLVPAPGITPRSTHMPTPRSAPGMTPQTASPPYKAGQRPVSEKSETVPVPIPGVPRPVSEKSEAAPIPMPGVPQSRIVPIGNRYQHIKSRVDTGLKKNRE